MKRPSHWISKLFTGTSRYNVCGCTPRILATSGYCLIKPQFEAGREKVGKKGVVREKSTHIEVIHSIIDFAKDMSFSILGLSHSPIRGPEGNIEYLLYMRKTPSGETPDYLLTEGAPEEIVELAHATL